MNDVQKVLVINRERNNTFDIKQRKYYIVTDVNNNTKLFSNFCPLLIDMTFMMARGSTASYIIAMCDNNEVYFEFSNCLK